MNRPRAMGDFCLPNGFILLCYKKDLYVDDVVSGQQRIVLKDFSRTILAL